MISSSTTPALWSSLKAPTNSRRIYFFSRFLASQPESQPFSFTCSNLRVEEGGVRLESEFNSNHEKIGMCLEPSTSNLMFIRVREFSELFAVRPPPNLFICVNQTSNFSRPATIRLIIHRVPSVGRNVREFSMSFAPRIEFEFLKPCFLFSFIFSRISRTQIHEFSTYIGFRLRHSRLLGTKSYPRTQIQS
jgi:hypothetical protein